MKKQVHFFSFLLFALLFAYLLRPSSEHMDKLFVVKGITLAAEYKKGVSDYFQAHKVLPDADAWSQSGLTITPDFTDTAVAAIHVGINGPGTITIVYDSNKMDNVPPDIHDKWIVLTPDIFGDQINWRCSGTVPSKYRPNACQ